MARGRKPKPTKLKVLQGNPGKRKLNKNEPQPKSKPRGPYCPRWLDKDAKNEWRRIAKQLKDIGLLTDVDTAVMAGYCQAYSRWKKAEEAIKKHGMIYKPNKDNDYIQQSPFVSISNKAQEQMRKFIVELGLSPSSRSKIEIPGGEDDGDSFDNFVNAK